MVYLELRTGMLYVEEFSCAKEGLILSFWYQFGYFPWLSCIVAFCLCIMNVRLSCIIRILTMSSLFTNKTNMHQSITFSLFRVNAINTILSERIR